MLKMGDSVMFISGKTSKVFTVSCDQFALDGDDTWMVTVEGMRGFIDVAMLVKVQSLFDREELQFEESMEAEFIEQPKEHHKLDEEDILILQEIKSHMRAGIDKLKERKLRNVNIELELTQFIRQQLAKE